MSSDPRIAARWVATTLVAASTACFAGPRHTVNNAPIRLRVVDARTQRPLPGIRVGYALETVILRGRLLGLIPAPEPTITYRLARTSRAETDGGGLATVQSTRLRLPGGERVVGEMVVVNLDVNREQPLVRIVTDTHEWSCKRAPSHCDDASADEVRLVHRLIQEDLAVRLAVLRNPNAGFLGAVLVSGESLAGRGDVDDRFRIRRGTGGAVARGDTIVVELEPAVDLERLKLDVQALERDLELGTVDRAEALQSIASKCRTLRLGGHRQVDQGQDAISKERDAYRALQQLQQTSPVWSWRLAGSFDAPSDQIEPLQDAVSRFPHDHEFRHELGKTLCRVERHAEGLEQLEEAARLVPPGQQGRYGWYSLKSDAESWCRDCDGGAPCRVDRILVQRNVRQTP